jgi:phosphatidylglycerophosphatase A
LIGLFQPMPLRRLGVFVATCAHVGYAPVAPGTFGSLLALVLYYLIRRQQSTAIELGAIAVIVVIGLWSATEAEHHFGGIDPGPVVIDEVVGMLITLALHPVNIWGAIIGFLIFRVLDIVKPWPARRLELLPGGFGVVLDDVMAGVYGNVIVWGLVSLLPSWLT